MPEQHDRGDGKKPLNGEMRLQVVDQPLFAVAGSWQATAKDNGFTMVTCGPNERVAPIHHKAMITVLEPADLERWLRGSCDNVRLTRPIGWLCAGRCPRRGGCQMAGEHFALGRAFCIAR